MPKIRILPEQLANRIAAGEVVERPASVVKELVENSLDAGASRIEVAIEGGGTRLIRVLDNGSGMDEDDVLLSLERHGTSKIDEAHDLIAINTLGFRGEAIPSIGSVAKMTIISKTMAADFGTKAEFEFGRLVKVHEIGCAQGTVIEVRNLFGRTPARKKFLRTSRTELGHIDEIMKNYALASPETVFILNVNGKETLNFTSGHTLENRFRTISNYQGKLIPVNSNRSTGQKSRKLHGFLIPPEQSSGGAARLRLFINGRAIRDRLMRHAIFEGLRNFLLKGHSPGGYIHLHLPADELDVNVHPAKHEVRFRSSGDIHQFIKQSIADTMRNHQQHLKAAYFGRREEDELLSSSSSTPADIAENAPVSFINRETGESASPTVVTDSAKDTPRPVQPLPFVASAPAIVRTHEPEAALESDEPREIFKHADVQLRRHDIRIIGQYKNLYIFCQAGDELLVIDQHAAHERLLFEKLRRQYLENQVASQQLLFPETVELSPLQSQCVADNNNELERMGFSFSEFGGNSYVISAVPALAGKCPASVLFFDVLASFGSEEGQSASGRMEHILATMACKAAVRSGDELSFSEIDGLLDGMAKADLFSHCPHGRPVLRSFSDQEMKKWFYRT